MQAIRCEICGSLDIVKKDGFFVCQYCGARYSAEEARRLLGTVRIDRSEDIENCLTLGRRAISEGNYPKAEEYYELVLRNQPDNLEAMYYNPFCSAMKADLTELESAAGAFRRSLRSLFDTVRQQEDGEKYIPTFLELVYENTFFFCKKKYRLAVEAYPSALKDPSMVEYTNAVSRGMTEIAEVYYFLEDTVTERFPENSTLLRRVREEELDFLKATGRYFMKVIPLMKEKNRLKKALK